MKAFQFLAFKLVGCILLSTAHCEEGNTCNENRYVLKAKRLLDWNREKLTNHSKLRVEDLNELFSAKFVMMANGRKYDADHSSYIEFLNQFRSGIEKIDYEVQEYIVDGSTVVMPLRAFVNRKNQSIDVFDAILIVKFNASGKIVHWQEVYSLQKS